MQPQLLLSQQGIRVFADWLDGMGELRRWMKSKKKEAELEDSPATDLLHRAIELTQDAET